MSMIHIQWYRGVVDLPYTLYHVEADEGSYSKKGPTFVDYA
jgi:hypothetical protein